MIIKNLYIQNFRCFGEEPAVINFASTGLMAFIGSNNAGKSTALKAIEILLGDKWPTSQFSEDDFYKKERDRKIVIACEFSEPVMARFSKNATEESPMAGLVVEVEYIDSGHGQSATEVSFQIVSKFNEFAKANWEIAGYSGRSDRPVYISQEIRNRLPIAITIPLIKLLSEQPTNKWGVLGRMLQKIENVFSQDDSKRKRFETSIAKAVKVLREPQEFGELERDVKEFWDSIRPNNLSGTTLEFLDYDPWHYYRQFRLAITKNGDDVPLDSLGEGVQRLAVIALYRAYLKEHNRSQKALLLIEEPESYLHPQARSVVYQTIRRAVESDDTEGQAIYTTHSSDFIDCSFHEEIVIFSETNKGSITRQVDEKRMRCQTAALTGIAPEKQADPKIYYRLIEVDTLGLKDALFGDRAVIVEGSTDFEFFKTFGKTDERQISIVVAGGKDNVPAVYSFLTAFGIPTLICVDRDNGGGNISNTEIVNLINEPTINQIAKKATSVDGAKIDQVAEGTIFSHRNLLVFSKDLEGFLSAKIPEHSELVKSLKQTLNLGASKPRLAFSLGLFARGKISSITPSPEQKKAVLSIRDDLEKFLTQKLTKPALIKCADDSGNIKPEGITF